MNWAPAYEADHYVEWLEYIAREYALYEAEAEDGSTWIATVSSAKKG